MLAKNQDPWAKFRPPKKDDTSPQSTPPIHATHGSAFVPPPPVPSVDKWQPVTLEQAEIKSKKESTPPNSEIHVSADTSAAKSLVDDKEPASPRIPSKRPVVGIFSKIKNRISTLRAKVWPKRIAPLEMEFSEALPEMRNGFQISLGTISKPSLKGYWRLLTSTLLATDRAIHDRIATRFPKVLAFTDWLLEWVYGTVSSGPFQIISGLIAAVILLVKPNLITAIVAIAWFITALWVARSRFVKSLTIGSRLLAIIFFSVFFGSAFYAFGRWALNEYQNQQAKSQSERVAPTPVLMPTPLPSPITQTVSAPAPTEKPVPAPSIPHPRKRQSKGLTEEEKWILRQLNSNKNAHAQASKDKQITKDELKRILARRLTKRGVNFLVKQVQEKGVSFKLTPDIEKELRDHAAKAGNKSIDSVIDAILWLEVSAKLEVLYPSEESKPSTSPIPMSTPTPSPSPRPTPDWKESEEAKQIASQLMNKVDKLIDEGKVIDLTNFDQAIKVYRDWVEKCSVILGQIDSELRRFGQNTPLKFRWDQNDRTIRKLKYVDEADQKRMFKLELNSSILILQVMNREIALATLPDLHTPATVPTSVAFLYRDKQIQIHNLTDMEFYLWGSKLGSGPVKMEQEPRVVSPEPFFYYIYGFDDLALNQMAEGSESRTVYYLFVEDHRRQKYTLRCLLWARKKDRELTVETQNLGTVEGWIQ